MMTQWTIAVAEDFPPDRELLTRALEGAGYAVLSFENGDQVKDHLIKGPSLPDLVIADWKMPKCDGIELCRLIKQSDQLRHIPVVILTGYTREEIQGIHGASTARANALVEKGGHFEALLITVRDLLAMRSR